MRSENVPQSSGDSILSIAVSNKALGVGGGEGAAPEPRLFLLVEVPPQYREPTLRLYEALEARRPPAALLGVDEVSAIG